MNPLEFEPTFETGHFDIDRHTRTLLAIANEVLFASALEESPRQFQSAVAFLVAYLDYHFASEEVAMAKEHYPSRHLHSAFHAHVLHEAAATKKRALAEGASEEARHTIYFMLEDWLIYHVQEDDRQFAAFLRQAPGAKAIGRLPGVRDLKASGSLSPDFDEQMLERAAALGHLERLPWLLPANETTRSAAHEEPRSEWAPTASTATEQE